MYTECIEFAGLPGPDDGSREGWKTDLVTTTVRLIRGILTVAKNQKNKSTTGKIKGPLFFQKKKDPKTTKTTVGYLGRLGQWSRFRE